MLLENFLNSYSLMGGVRKFSIIVVFSTVNREVYFLVLWILFLVFLLGFGFLGLNYLLGNYLVIKLKKSSFERGFNSIGKIIVSYSLVFFFMVLVFVFFELEFFLVFFLLFFSFCNFYLLVMVVFLVTLSFIIEWGIGKLLFLNSS